MGSVPFRTMAAQVASDLFLGQLGERTERAFRAWEALSGLGPRTGSQLRQSGTWGLWKGRGGWERDCRGRTPGSGG